MVAQVTGLDVGELVHTLGDAHIYLDHIEQVKTQLTREPKPLPRLRLNPQITDIDDFALDDIAFENYEHWPAIKGEVSV
jgi:thymidylate synthase